MCNYVKAALKFTTFLDENANGLPHNFELKKNLSLHKKYYKNTHLTLIKNQICIKKKCKRNYWSFLGVKSTIYSYHIDTKIVSS